MAENTDSNAKSAQERGRAAITSAAQRATGAIEEGAGRMADAGHSATDITERTAAAGAETIRHLGDTAGEAVRRGSQQFADMQQKFAHDVAKDFAFTFSSGSGIFCLITRSPLSRNAWLQAAKPGGIKKRLWRWL